MPLVEQILALADNLIPIGVLALWAGLGAGPPVFSTLGRAILASRLRHATGCCTPRWNRPCQKSVGQW
jgi:hypothetical protein